MDNIRFALIGSGWRSFFYLRVAAALPSFFSVVGVKVRTNEKKLFIEENYGVPAFLTDEELLDRKPEFIVVSVSKNQLFTVSRHYQELGFPVLVETPGASGDELDAAISYKAPSLFGVAEQYFLRPRLSAALSLVGNGLIGTPQSLYISLCHDYHGISLIRRFLKEMGHPVSLFSDYHTEKILGGFSRYREAPLEELVEDGRRISVYRFESGKHAVYDFASSQYHSPLRRSAFRVDGEKGYIDQDGIAYADSNLAPRRFKFNVESSYMDRNDPDMMQQRVEVVDKITAGDMLLFENRFPGAVLSEDEYAIALLLLNFRAALKGREELLYPAHEGFLDAKFC